MPAQCRNACAALAVFLSHGGCSRMRPLGGSSHEPGSALRMLPGTDACFSHYHGKGKRVRHRHGMLEVMPRAPKRREDSVAGGLCSLASRSAEQGRGRLSGARDPLGSSGLVRTFC